MGVSRQLVLLRQVFVGLARAVHGDSSPPSSSEEATIANVSEVDVTTSAQAQSLLLNFVRPPEPSTMYFDLKAGGNLTTGSATLGYVGTLTNVTLESGATWTNQGAVFEINEGLQMDVQAGATMTTHGVDMLAASQGTSQSASVFGIWNNTGLFNIGGTEQGSPYGVDPSAFVRLRVSAGGVVTTTSAVIGKDWDPLSYDTGQLAINGGSFAATGDVTVGFAGKGSLLISGGGQLSADTVTVAATAAGSGILSLASGTMTVGQLSRGTGQVPCTSAWAAHCNLPGISRIYSTASLRAKCSLRPSAPPATTSGPAASSWIPKHSSSRRRPPSAGAALSPSSALARSRSPAPTPTPAAPRSAKKPWWSATRPA